MGLETVTITKPEEGGIGYVTFVSMDQITSSVVEPAVRPLNIRNPT